MIEMRQAIMNYLDIIIRRRRELFLPASRHWLMVMRCRAEDFRCNFHGSMRSQSELLRQPLGMIKKANEKNLRKSFAFRFERSKKLFCTP